MSEGEKELPQGWADTTIGNVISEPRTKVKPDTSSKLPFIGMDHIESESFVLVGQDEFKNMKSAGSPFSPGDVLYGRLRPYLNKVHTAKFEGVASAEFIVLPKAETHSSEFFKFLLHHIRFVHYANAKSSGDRPRVKFDRLAEYDFWLPPLAEQSRIVDKIDELFSSIEAGERAIARARTALTRYRKAVLKAAVTGELTADWRAKNPPSETAEDLLARILKARYSSWEKAELEKLDAKGKARPETEKEWAKFRARYKEPSELDLKKLPPLPNAWAWGSVDILCPDDTANGISVAGSLDPPGVPALRLDAITPNGFDYSKRRYIDISAAKAASMAVREGHLYVSRANGSKERMGKAILAKKPPELIVYPDTIIRFGILPEFVEWLNMSWKSFLVRSFLEEKAKTSAGIWKIAQSDIKPMPISIPPIDEQAEILSRVEQALSKADKAEATLSAQAKQAKALKQAVLKTAFEGRLVPQNPKDEPASELLKRIKAAS